MASAQVVHPDEQTHERPVPGAVAAAFLRAHVEAYGRTCTGALAAAVVRVSVEKRARAHCPASRLRGARDPQNSDPQRVKRLFLQVCADGRADPVALRCADQQTVLHSDGCPERTAELAALVEAHIRTDVKTNDATLCQADRVERAPLNIVCLVSPPYPPPPPLP